MSKVARKPWGRSTSLTREPMVHSDIIKVEAGGFCSIHRHNGKANVFHVLKGMLVVRQLAVLNASPYCRAIGPGESRTVPAGVWHQFWCPEETFCIEVYLPHVDGLVLDADDIERHPACEVGGRDKSGTGLDERWAAAFGGILEGRH